MLNDKIKGAVIGLLVGSTLTGSIAFAKSGSQWIEAVYSDIKIYVNGNKVNTSSNEPFIYNGTTHLPVRAVAEALGESVDWDGNTKSVYIGQKSVGVTLMTDVNNIGDRFYTPRILIDNYGNTYSYAYHTGSYDSWDGVFETLLNEKYSRFTCTLYVPEGCNSTYTAKILIKADGNIIYSSPSITKTSKPIKVDLDITGCNDFKIEVTDGGALGYIGDGKFYK